jgi:general secretion pathway protein J
MRFHRARRRGMTMIEVVVAIGVLAMVAVLVHGVINSLSHGKKAEAERADRVHQGREALQRIVRDLSGAYLSAQVPTIVALRTELTSFTGRSSSQFDRLDFTSFAHRRTERDVNESDQAEVGYFASQDPDVSDKWDLARREQTPIDLEPLKGGIIDVIAEDIQEFDLRYLDPTTGQWLETWDSVQTTGQPNRLPLEVKIRLVLKGVGDGSPYEFATKVFIPIQQPLSFAIPRQ